MRKQKTYSPKTMIKWETTYSHSSLDNDKLNTTTYLFFPFLFNFPPLSVTPPVRCMKTLSLTHTYTQSCRQSHPLIHTLSSRDPECLARSNCTEILCSPYKVAAASHVTDNLHAVGRQFALECTHRNTYAHAKPCFPLGWRSKAGRR